MLTTNKQNILKDGKPFFYLADTCWSAFTNITDEEWDYYLYQRKCQGFNALQINILPQWDASSTELDYKPILNNNWHQLNDDYFAHAKRMCVKAKKEGFELALVLLWCNYIPGTWASKMIPDGVIPMDAIENYVNKVHETFSGLEPIYVISGDTDFNELSTPYYVKGGSQLKNLAPNCLFTAHIKGRYSEIPDELYSLMDIVFYQSGHNAKDKSMPYSLSEEMQRKYPGKPLINSEPCYEDMGYSGNMFGRWNRQEIRCAAYQSVLSGACAGVTYGANGIYPWHKVNKYFAALLGEGFDTPRTWNECMTFPGAWDYGYLKNLVEKLNIYGLTPRQDLLVNNTSDIRIAQVNDDFILVYSPANTKIRLKQDFTGLTCQAIGLEDRFISDINLEIKEGVTALPMHSFAYDALYILKK